MTKAHTKHTTRREFLRDSCIAAVGINYLGIGKAHASPAEDPPNTHNMLVVGEKNVFLSHLPMFGSADPKADGFSPHRFQVILEATFTKDGKNVQGVYVKDRREHQGTKMYTIGPTKEFVLQRLASSDPQLLLRSFEADVFRGHLERIPRPPKPIEGLGNVDVNVKKVIHFREFDPKITKPSELEYILFGKGDELFLAHLITQVADFDQILSVHVVGQALTDEELGRGVHVVIPGSKNSAPHRMKTGQEVAGMSPATGGGVAKELKLQVAVEFYFEEGELGMPMTFKQTEEERKAGF
jgi:hypothetical protein